MQTSDPGSAKAVSAPKMSGLVSLTVLVREAALAAVLATGLLAVISPRDLGWSIRPHPAWLVVFLLAARHGSRGLACSFAITASTLVLAAFSMGAGGGIAVASVADANLGALALSVLVAWVASSHERRNADQTRRLSELTRQLGEGAAGLVQLEGATEAARARVSRREHSISFLRQLTTSLEGCDAVAGATAALELAMAHSGARAGVIQIADHGHLRIISWRGPWSALGPQPTDLVRDSTSHSAFSTGGTVRAVDLTGGGPDDSDIATPIPDDDGTSIGVLALRGVLPGAMGTAGGRDLELVAQWCGKSICAQRALAAESGPKLRPLV